MSTQSSEIKQHKSALNRTVTQIDQIEVESKVQDHSENQDLNIENIPKRASSYANISYDTRFNFVQEVNNTKCTIKCAAKKYKINFSTAKAIMQIYRREGRIGKKQRRETKKKLICTSPLSGNDEKQIVSPLSTINKSNELANQFIEIKIEEEQLQNVKNSKPENQQEIWNQQAMLQQQYLYYLQIQRQQMINYQIWNFNNQGPKQYTNGQTPVVISQTQSVEKNDSNIVKLEQL